MRQAGLRDGRQPRRMSRTILGKPPELAAEGEKQVFSSPNSVLISPCEHPNDLWTQPKVSSEEKAYRLPPTRSLFFHHYDWNRWFASLATTVDNTIKMADRSFKHGRQWCIRRVEYCTCSLDLHHGAAADPQFESWKREKDRSKLNHLLNKLNRQAIFWTACVSMGIHVFFLGLCFFFRTRALVCSWPGRETEKLIIVP